MSWSTREGVMVISLAVVNDRDVPRCLYCRSSSFLRFCSWYRTIDSVVVGSWEDMTVMNEHHTNNSTGRKTPGPRKMNKIARRPTTKT